MLDFLKYRKFYLLLSLSVIGVGMFFVFRFGFRYSIDFVGGTNLSYKANKEISKALLDRVALKNKIEISELVINGQQVSIRAKAISEKTESRFIKELEKEGKTKIVVLKSETVGPTLGKETMSKTVIASVFAVLGIMVYMSFAFKGYLYAISAILAMFHDLLVIFGLYAVIGYFYKAEVDTMFVTAVLTTMSFSVHDTIVIFDKIREYIGSEGKGNLYHYANRALTETMVRSINNSMTILFMLLALALLGGETIRFFVIALLIGTITGTYSSPFVATPLLVFLEKIKKNDR